MSWMVVLQDAAFDRVAGSLIIRAMAIGWHPERWSLAAGAAEYLAEVEAGAADMAAGEVPTLSAVCLTIRPRANPMESELVLRARAGSQMLSLPIPAGRVRILQSVKGGISRLSYQPWSRRLLMHGWFVAWQKLTRLEVLVDGHLLCEATLDVPRGDVAPDFPMLAGEHAGWEVTAVLPKSGGSPQRLELLAYAGEDFLFSRRRRLHPEQDYVKAAAQPWWALMLLPIARRVLPNLATGWQRRAFACWMLGKIWYRPGVWSDLRVETAQSLARHPECGPLRIVLRNGDRVLCDPFNDQVVGRAFLLDGTYEPAVLGVLPVLLRAGETMVDVGACYGHVALAASHIAEHVLAVEPNPLMYPYLEVNFSERPHIRLTRMAAGAQEATLNLTVDEANFGATSLVPPSEAETSHIPVLSLASESWGRQVLAPGRRRHEVAVDVVPLDQLLAGTATPHPALIKIDVEGAEGQVLDGAAVALGTHPRPAWIVEHSRLVGAEGAADQVFGRFLALGYLAFRFDLPDGKPRFTPVLAAADAPAHCNLLFAPPERLERLEARLVEPG